WISPVYNQHYRTGFLPAIIEHLKRFKVTHSIADNLWQNHIDHEVKKNTQKVKDFSIACR
ncbi:MAG: hypothetical protein QF872_10775, partial [Gammaproteobacteria bacterium]|nr:hypothetical protein [Gammaproteobacteria bacterium]